MFSPSVDQLNVLSDQLFCRLILYYSLHSKSLIPIEVLIQRLETLEWRSLSVINLSILLQGLDQHALLNNGQI